MNGNSIGKAFTISTFGESHGKAIGVIIDGCPANLPINIEYIQHELNRRRPAQSAIVTQRKENDTIEILSGVFENKSTGTPIAILIQNQNQRSSDYEHIAQSYRPSHADFTYDAKYLHRDYRGGGRSSARETAARVAAGAVAKLLLQQFNIQINAYVSQVGNLQVTTPYQELNFENIEKNPVRCACPKLALEMEDLIRQVKKNGDTIGGVITCIAKQVPVGLGSPVFDKLHADLGKAILSINACKGFEYGSGFAGVAMLGSQHNDIFAIEKQQVKTITNYSGGIQGGISNGMDIYFKAAFKPVATIMKPQNTIDKNLNTVIIEGKGRHDPCVLPRAVPIVEAMAAITIADHLLRHKMVRL